jgi:hypothetical protein
MDDEEVSRLRAGRKRQDGADRSANKARIQRSSKLTKAERERLLGLKQAKTALLKSFAPADITNDDGTVSGKQFVKLLCERRDRVMVSLAYKCRMVYLRETAHESGLRNLFWLRAHGMDPNHPLPSYATPSNNSYYKEMVEHDVSRVKALFDVNPAIFTPAERQDLHFYFYMLKERAIQPNRKLVDYYSKRVVEKYRLKNFSAGENTKGNY